MIELKQNDVVNLMIQKIKENGSSKTGTYNKADPTHFEKGSATFDLQYDPAEYVTLEIEFNDCTWGVEFEISYKDFDEDNVKLKGYWSREKNSNGGVWTERHKQDRNNRLFFKTFKSLLLHSESEGHYTQNDNACDMGYGSCE